MQRTGSLTRSGLHTGHSTTLTHTHSPQQPGRGTTHAVKDRLPKTSFPKEAERGALPAPVHTHGFLGTRRAPSHFSLVLPGESRRRCDCQGLKLWKHGTNARQEALHGNGKHHAPRIGTTKPTRLPWTRSFSIHLPRQSAKKTFPPNMSQRDDFGLHPQHPVLFSTQLQVGKSLDHPRKHRSATSSWLPGSEFTDGMHIAFRNEKLNQELHLP